ncbi:uncharacterized protein isoform X2 [Choristoneura fumiferana]|uniref:uncharacterized protein isoform X2 n=1 Tax=Choristoneura fumiferana TaxID=7141 RepID=UPI003D156240
MLFGKKRKKPRKKNPNLSAAIRPAITVVQNTYNLKEKFSNFTAKYIAPHHDEPEDLTDDLAPKVSAPSVATKQPVARSSQPSSAGTDNKLSFKFQKTKPKTPDWTKFQNSFQEQCSPDLDPEETQGENEQKPQNKLDQQTKNTEVNTGKSQEISQSQSDVLASLPPSVMKVVQEKLKQLPTPKTPIIMPKEVDPPVEKPVQQPKKVTTTSLKPIEVRFERNKIFKTDHNRYTFPNQSAIMTHFDYPKGIPKSFLLSHEKEMQEMEMAKAKLHVPPNPNTPMPATKPGTSDVSETKVLAALELPSWILPTQALVDETPAQQSMQNDLGANTGANTPTLAQNETIPDRPYSPSDVYAETVGKAEEESRDGSESPDIQQPGEKRLSAFKRLGPLNITKPKKPKLTINLMINKEQAIREVVNEGAESYRYVPIHLRSDVLKSEDEIVKKYLPFWPWKKNVTLRKTVSARYSKSVMILEQEQMETGYEKDSCFIQVLVKGYPTTWTKEDVMDAVLECVKGKSFIPCFVEFTSQECKFLVIRSRAALIAIHKVGFHIRKGDIELAVFISLTDLSLNQIDMIPRLVLRKRLMTHYDGENKLDLRGFFTEKDVSHFLYFPLNRVTNQVELIQLQSAVNWEYLVDLNLSNNRITTLDGFDLQTTTPKLKHLDLSHNFLDKLTLLLRCRNLPLRSIKLEGNPLCLDYIDGEHYIKVLKMIFSELREIDGVPLTFKGDFLPMKSNYCPEAAVGVVEKFLETFFPLLEAPYDDRAAIEDLYDKDAVLTVTFRNKLRYGSAFRYFRNLFLRARNLKEGDWETIRGAPSIGSLINKWPAIQHDQYTITVDVLHHDDSTTILRIGGILKLTAESLAEDEHHLTFTRNIVLHTKNGSEYKIHHEMLYWDVPCEESMLTAFNITTVRSKAPTLKLESPPDDELKSQLLNIFVKLADIDKKRGERCLEIKNWDLRSALDHYIRLLKLDDLSSLRTPEETPEPVAQAS